MTLIATSIPRFELRRIPPFGQPQPPGNPSNLDELQAELEVMARFRREVPNDPSLTSERQGRIRSRHGRVCWISLILPPVLDRPCFAPYAALSRTRRRQLPDGDPASFWTKGRQSSSISATRPTAFVGTSRICLSTAVFRAQETKIRLATRLGQVRPALLRGSSQPLPAR